MDRHFKTLSISAHPWKYLKLVNQVPEFLKQNQFIRCFSRTGFSPLRGQRSQSSGSEWRDRGQWSVWETFPQTPSGCSEVAWLRRVRHLLSVCEREREREEGYFPWSLWCVLNACLLWCLCVFTLCSAQITGHWREAASFLKLASRSWVWDPQRAEHTRNQNINNSNTRIFLLVEDLQYVTLGTSILFLLSSCVLTISYQKTHLAQEIVWVKMIERALHRLNTTERENQSTWKRDV